MDFNLNDEQRQLRDSVRRYLRDRYGFEKRAARLIASEHFDARVWNAFAHDLGILGLGARTKPDPTDILIVMEALGEALVLEPFGETIVTGASLLRSCGADCTSLLDAIVTGDVRLALAWAEPETRYSWTPQETRAVRQGGGWRLDGIKAGVTGAPAATHILITALTPSGVSVFIAPASADGLTLAPYRTIDGRPAGDVRLEGLALPDSALIGIEGGALPALECAGAWSIAAQCAEALGIMRKMLQLTMSYLRERRQFGQPLGEFQALQHRMAEMLVQTEMAASATYLALLKLDAPPQDRDRASSVAKVITGEAARFVGQSAIQLHGGMGMTNEMPISHYFRRATVLGGEFGSPDHHLRMFERHHLGIAVA